MRKTISLNKKCGLLGLALYFLGAFNGAQAACPGVVAVDTTVNTANAGCAVTWTGGNLTVTAAGTIVNAPGIAINFTGATVGTLDSAGLISGGNPATFTGYGIWGQNSTITSINNSGSILGGRYGLALYGVTAGSITNSGTINGPFAGVTLSDSAAASHVTTFTNTASGVITEVDIEGGSLVNTFLNDGNISVNGIQMYDSSIGALTNNGTITSTEDMALYLTGTSAITTLINTGTIVGTGYSAYLESDASITTVTNNGTMRATNNYGFDLFNNAHITNLTNNGQIISDGDDALCIYDNASISTITNHGVINGQYAGIDLWDSGTSLGLLVNTGTITGAQYSLYAAGTITSPIQNDGSLIGKIHAEQDLTFTGGSSSAYGVISGTTVAADNLLFDGSAFQRLAANISLGAGTLTNAGHLQFNTAQTLTGNFSQTAAGTLVIGVTDALNFGTLTVTGNSNMAGSSVVLTPLVNGALNSGDSFAVVQTAGTADYSGVTASAAGFSSVTVSSVIDGLYKKLLLTLGAVSAGPPPAATPDYEQIASVVDRSNSKTMGRVLNRIYGAGGSTFTPVFTSLDNLGAATATYTEGVAIRSLAPSQMTSELLSTGLGAHQAAQMVSQHQAGHTASATGSGSGLSSGSSYRNGVFWGQASGGTAHKNKTETVGGYDDYYYGLTAGIDTGFGKNSIGGGALSYVRNTAYGTAASDGTNLHVNSYQLSLYDTTRFYQQGFVNLLAGIGYNTFEQRRFIAFVNQTATASYHGLQYYGKADAGWDVAWPNDVTFTPVAGVEFVYSDNSAYTESGAGVANAAVGQQGVGSFASTIGFKLSTNATTAWGRLVPEFKLMWLHDFSDRSVTTNASMGGVGFQTYAQRANENGVRLGLGATLKRDDNFSLRAQYDGEYRADYTSHTGQVKALFAF